MTRDGAIQAYGPLDMDPNGQEFVPGTDLENVVPSVIFAPFWCDSEGGTVTFGAINAGDTGADAQLQKANDCVRAGFPLTPVPFVANRLFVATWTNVRAVGGGAQVNRLMSYCCKETAL